MTRTFLKKNQTKKHLQSEKEVYTDSRSIQGDSTIIKTHPATLNIPPKGKTQGIRELCAKNPRIYADIPVKTACTHDCEDKTHVQEEKEIKKKVNRQSKMKFTSIRHQQENMPSDPTQKQRNQSNSSTLNADKKPQRK